MNIIDWFYVLGRPLAYVSMVTGIWRIVQTKSTKSFSLTAWGIGVVMVGAIFIRSLFSLHDALFWVNAGIGLIFNLVEFGLIVKWRKQ